MSPLAEAIIESAHHFSSYIHNPVKYVEETVLTPHRLIYPNLKIEPQQADMLDAIAEYDRVAVKGGNGMGKDAACAWSLEWFLMTRPMSKVPCTAGVGRQIRSMLWSEVHRWSKRSLAAERLDIMDSTRVQVKGYEKSWFAEGFAAGEGAKAEGYHAPNLLYIITEAKAVEADIWNAVFKACSGEGNKILCQSVPGEEVGDFFELFHMRRRPWKFFSFSTAELKCPRCKQPTHGMESCARCRRPAQYVTISDLVSQVSVDEKLDYGMDGPLFQAGVLSNFVKSSADHIVPMPLIEAAQRRWHDVEEPINVFAIAGVDIGAGSAETAISYRRGNWISPIKAFVEADADKATERIAAELAAIPGLKAAYLDKIGVGWGIVAAVKKRLRSKGILVEGVSVGDKTREPERFADLSSQLWWHVREAAELRGEDGLALPPDNILVAQLGSRKFGHDDLRIKIETKKQMATRGVRSPDRMDSVVLTYWTKKRGPRIRQLGADEPKKDFPEEKAPAFQRERKEATMAEMLQAGLVQTFGEE